MAEELSNNGQHICTKFSDLTDTSASQAVQWNRFLISTGGHGTLTVPGFKAEPHHWHP